MSDGPTGPYAQVAVADERLRVALGEALDRAVGHDDPVRHRLLEWVDGIGGDDPEAAIDRAAARQASVLTNHVRYRATVGDRPPAHLRETPVAPFRGTDVPSEVEAALDSLASKLADSPGLSTDVIGARYAEALSADERRARGQFYTPSAVAEAVTEWALEGAGGEAVTDPPRVLDPAAGTGTFPLAALDVLRERHPGSAPDSLLSSLVAVDVDEVALHVAALRLSARMGGRPVEGFDRRPCSFFDLEPGADGAAAVGAASGTIAPVDAVVGNPPFVRAGDLTPDREHFRRHLDAFGRDGDSPYADGDAALSRRSDAYVYFVTHATRFLRPGGRLGMVLPSKWLGSEYGADFRRFLHDQYDVRAVVGFGARAFDALVDTVLLLAERREQPGAVAAGARLDGSARGDVSFVRLEEPLDPSASLAELVGDGPVAGNGGRRREAREAPARVVRRDRSSFATAEKCSPYLRAPADLLPLLDHPAFVPLGELARISRGVTTGANRFFLLDAADRERWGIDPALLRPAVRSIRGVESRTVSADDVALSMVDVHGFLAGRPGCSRDGAQGTDPTARAKAVLREAGHDALVAYVEYAEAEGWHEGRTCRTRPVWFDLGALPTPDAFVPKLLRERVFTVRNRARAVPTNAIDCLSVREGIDPEVLLGVLDSSVCKALMEVWGRNEAGMLQLMTYETRTLPVPDVRRFGADAAASVAAAAARFDADGAGQADLDAAVHAAADLDLQPGRAREMRERLLARRVDGGDRIEVPVS